MHVTVPGNATDVGGVKIVPHYQKELEESDTSSTSDADSSFKHEMGPLKLLSLRALAEEAILYTNPPHVHETPKSRTDRLPSMFCA